jgi:hypothetical protein
MGLGIGFGVQLHTVCTHGAGSSHGGRIRIHEQTHASAQVFRLSHQVFQDSGVCRKAPAVVRGELALGIRHKSDLVRPHQTNQGHQVVQRVAFDVVFAVWPVFHQRRQVVHIAVANMALVRTGMHRDAVGTSLQTQGGRAGDAGNTEVAGVAHQRNLVHIYGEVGVHRACKSIITWRVRKLLTPQW